MPDGDKNTPLRKQLNLSGIPFQLRVERLIRTIPKSDAPIWTVLREVPAGDGFLDIVCGVENKLVVFECKRITDKDWIFVTDGSKTASECRLEYFNGNADPEWVIHQGDRVFVETWLFNPTMPEADFCVAPKASAESSVEAICRTLLSRCRSVLGDKGIGHGDFVVAVPVIVTTARLWLCEVSEGDVDIESGTLGEGKGAFSEVSAIRFTKTFADRRSNHYETNRLDLDEWAEDRMRTVFVLGPAAIPAFLRDCRYLIAKHGRLAPAAFVNPPEPKR